MAKHKTIEELRRAVADAAADWIESDLALGVAIAVELGYTWDSPIEERLVVGLAVAAQEKRFGVELFAYRKGVIEWRVTSPNESPTCSAEGRAVPDVIGHRPVDAGQYGYTSGARLLRVYRQVSIDRYRADLFVEFTTTGFQEYAIGGEDTRRAVIECDGHDFHERTKEQARHDRRRDREVQGFGLPILRFTGSEIYADAVACGHQILKFFIDAAERDFQRSLAQFAGSSGDAQET